MTLFGKCIREYQQLVVEKIVLNTSFNVTTSIRRVPYLNMIVPVEEVAPRIAKAQANKISWKIREGPDKAKSPKSNLTREEGERCNSDQTHKIRSQDAASPNQTFAA